MFHFVFYRAIRDVLSYPLIIATLVMLFRVEGRATVKLLPRTALHLRSSLGALYATMALLAVTVTCTEVFVPLFLQELHALGPLGAGLLAAVMVLTRRVSWNGEVAGQ